MSSSLQILPIQTPIFSQGGNLIEFLLENVDPSLWQEGTVIAITSKLVSLAEGRLVNPESSDKKSLIQQEAEHYLGEIGHAVNLTIKQGLLLAAAGIDESNSAKGDYILHPKDPFQSAQMIHRELRRHLGLQNLGVILTDSRTSPLRLGVTGVALSFAGFEPLKNMVGEKDLFGRPLKMTKINIVDSLAAIAVLTMGEAAECRPLALIKNADLHFTDHAVASDLIVSTEDDIYAPLYRHLIK